MRLAPYIRVLSVFLPRLKDLPREKQLQAYELLSDGIAEDIRRLMSAQK
ncbi:MAG: hypothetical protein H9791_00620 [Candidatus Bacteroides intestinipullorum]|uniref:Uncharacterized protein n=1 Tax=Candidatus Bacteroides intestinipullorum TaxID=2838471 RepID=A0A9E2NMJ6_9BACE|nr:hypothetical protein [Candidatus Bacteroides intestinipullorum]